MASFPIIIQQEKVCGYFWKTKSLRQNPDFILKKKFSVLHSPLHTVIISKAGVLFHNHLSVTFVNHPKTVPNWAILPEILIFVCISNYRTVWKLCKTYWTTKHFLLQSLKSWDYEQQSHSYFQNSVFRYLFWNINRQIFGDGRPWSTVIVEIAVPPHSFFEWSIFFHI